MAEDLYSSILKNWLSLIVCCLRSDVEEQGRQGKDFGSTPDFLTVGSGGRRGADRG
jgi:hypothetical protein